MSPKKRAELPDLSNVDWALVEHILEHGTDEQKQAVLPLAQHAAKQLENRAYDWKLRARPEQLAPKGDYLVWLIISGRRWGKTLSAAEWLRDRCLAEKGAYAICAPTYGDVRDICVEGGLSEPANRRSGFQSVCQPGEIRQYNRSHGELRMRNGSRIKMLSADEPDRARGWGFNAAWCDEISSWRYPATWYETLMPAVSMSDNHRFVVTTTPKTNRITRELLARAGADSSVVLTRGRTVDNAINLGAGVVDELRRNMSKRLARQELDGELLLDVEGALVTYALLDSTRGGTPPAEARTIVAVDPSGGSTEGHDEQGIVVVSGSPQEAWIVADRSCRLTPDGWGSRAIQAAVDYQADMIVWETNYGGEMVELVLNDVMDVMGERFKLKGVHASKGKRPRAEPIVAAWEQGRLHLAGSFPELEDQWTSWVPTSGQSPDRLDASVWALTELMIKPSNSGGVFFGNV